MTQVGSEGRVGYMLEGIAFVTVCVIAALFPTLTAYVIFGAVVVILFPRVRDRWSNRK